MPIFITVIQPFFFLLKHKHLQMCVIEIISPYCTSVQCEKSLWLHLKNVRKRKCGSSHHLQNQECTRTKCFHNAYLNKSNCTMHLEQTAVFSPWKANKIRVYSLCSQQVLRHHEKKQKTTANKLRDYLKWQKKCQSLAVVHITVLRLINGSESRQAGKQRLSSFWVRVEESAATPQHFVPSSDCVKAKNVLRENTENNLWCDIFQSAAVART